MTNYKWIVLFEGPRSNTIQELDLIRTICVYPVRIHHVEYNHLDLLPELLLQTNKAIRVIGSKEAYVSWCDNRHLFDSQSKWKVVETILESRLSWTMHHLTVMLFFFFFAILAFKVLTPRDT